MESNTQIQHIIALNMLHMQQLLHQIMLIFKLEGNIAMIIQIVQLLWLFVDSNSSVAALSNPLQTMMSMNVQYNEFLAHQYLQLLPILFTNALTSTSHQNDSYYHKIIKLILNQLMAMIRLHPSMTYQEQLYDMIMKLILYQIDDVLGQHLRHNLSLLLTKQSPDQVHHWKQHYSHIIQQIQTLSYGIVQIGQNCSREISVTLVKEWSKLIIDLVVRCISYCFNHVYLPFLAILMDGVNDMIQALITPLIGLKQMQFPLLPTNISMIQSMQSNQHDFILNENVLSMRLWLALFIWYTKLKVAVDQQDVEIIKEDLLQQLARVTFPISFSRILCNTSTSKKKNSDIVDELFDNDNDLVSGV